MRILTTSEQPVAVTVNLPVPAPAPAGLDPERIVSLEQVVFALKEKIRALEERLGALESMPRATAVAPTRAPITPAIWDADEVKKNLLTKMWKYLQDDERPAKAV